MILGGTDPLAGGGKGAGSATLVTTGDGNIKVISDNLYVAYDNTAVHAAGALNIDPLDNLINSKWTWGDPSVVLEADRDEYIDAPVGSNNGSVTIVADLDKILNTAPDIKTGVMKTTYGDIFLNSTVDAATDVYLFANNGSLYGPGNDMIKVIAGGDAYIDAQLGGTLDLPVNVDVDGTLS